MDKPRIVTGALVGGLLTAALVALLALADGLAGLPFVPFDVFDWVARTLPGGVITFGIDAMVSALIALNLNVSEAAKTAEQAMAIAALLGAGVVGGAALFAVLRRMPDSLRRSLIGGLALGLIVGLPGLVISLSVNQTATAGPLASALWILAAFLAWGALIGWSYARLAVPVPRRGAAASVTTAEHLTAEQLDRRRFLIRLGAGTAAITVVGARLAPVFRTRERAAPSGPADPGAEEAALLAALGADPTLGAAALLAALPNADDPLAPAPGTRPEYTPLEAHYRIDINARPPRVDGPTWRLPITGMVANEVELALSDLVADFEPLHRFVTLSCISNRIGGDLIGTTLWTGARLSEVLAVARPLPGARFLLIEAADGFHEALSLDLLARDDRIMLTYHWDGQPLTEEHGYPLRIYIPDRYGMKQPKWITRFELAADERPGYWVQRGWDEVARVQATSVIDTVAGEEAFERDGQTYVPIGGIAYAGARGIGGVEVRVDGSEWTQADLRAPLSDTTWVIWRIDWPLSEGEHFLEVRCVEANGAPQIDRLTDVRPSGATGLHRITRQL